ncbi:MAG: hypothetical protein IK134_04315 [Oscillospiraceae bacterium]|nr:hypothetical protein [Oscillospiraceae bacterium]
MTNQNRNDGAEIIDVAYQTATNDELFSSQTQAQQRAQAQKAAADQNEEALMELAREVMLDPERCFCRCCGQPIYKNASVCVHCHYVVNPTALRQGQRVVRARREKYETSKITRIHRFITNLTGVDLEPEAQKRRWAVRQQDYHFDTGGKVYCSNCGCIVDPNATVCVNCNYVLNPVALRRAQIAISDKNAKVTRAELIKSALIPGFGFKLSRQYRDRRPQVALPCLKAGLANTAAVGMAVLAILIAFLS